MVHEPQLGFALIGSEPSPPRGSWPVFLKSLGQLARAIAQQRDLARRYGLPFTGAPIEAAVGTGPMRGLQVLNAPPGFVPDENVPATVGECPTKRPCPHVRCRMNMSLIESDSRPGRRHQDGRPIPPVLVVWPGQSNCTLDHVEQSPDGIATDDIGSCFGVVGERVSQIEKRAMLKVEGASCIMSLVEEGRSSLGEAISIEHATPHGATAVEALLAGALTTTKDPNLHAVTFVYRVTPKDDKRRADASSRAGVRVRRRRMEKP